MGKAKSPFRSRIAISAVVACFVIGSLTARASESEPGEGHGEEAQHEEEHHKKHALSVFVGATHEHGEYHPTVGIEYGYHFSHLWSFGVVIERADREKSSTLGIVFVQLHPFKGLFLTAGAGRKDPDEKRQVTYRLGIGWEFELKGDWIIAPQLNFDFVDDEENEEVAGISFGRRF